MMTFRPNRDLADRLRCAAAAVTLLAALTAAHSQTVVLHLKNGDRIAGTVVSEDTNHVVVSTPWIKELTVPLSAITLRETVLSQAAATNSPAPKVPPGPRVALSSGNSPSSTNAVKHLKGEAHIGADYFYGAKDQQLYYGRLKLAYEDPYPANPKHFFRNTLDYTVNYGWAENPSVTSGSKSVLSANDMYGSDKTTADCVTLDWYSYNIGGAGYDEIRKISFGYEEGPGIGYHVLTDSNLLLNAESGADYQVQYRSDDTRTKDVFFRLAEDLTWKLNKSVKFVEKFEFFPRSNSSEYRARAESTISYALWHNLSLNFTLLDFYDTQPAAGVPSNDLQVHSSVGLTF